MARRILVVDDEEDIRTILEHILLRQGFEVGFAANGQEALDRLKESAYDLMVLDVRMPVMDGFEVLEALDPDLKEAMPIVMLTAKSTDNDVIDGYSNGASYYITKPFDNVTLLNAILFMLGELSEEEMAEMELKL